MYITHIAVVGEWVNEWVTKRTYVGPQRMHEFWLKPVVSQGVSGLDVIIC